MFERGYKTWCEKYSLEVRAELGINKDAPLDATKFASHLGIRVWRPADVPCLADSAIKILLRNDGKTPSCWSAVTVVVESKVLIILNSSHSEGRQASDLTHELAHLIRGHEAVEMSLSGDGLMLLQSYEKREEEEADWLASCLLLPRPALTTIKRSGLEEKDAALEYGVSVRMLKYRLAVSGVNRQFS